MSNEKELDRYALLTTEFKKFCIDNNVEIGKTGYLLGLVVKSDQMIKPQTTDLHEDRIVPWRLEEIGFRDMPTISNKGRWILRLENGMNIIIFEDMIPFLEVSYNELKEIYATTFSELEMLIKFLTPPKQ